MAIPLAYKAFASSRRLREHGGLTDEELLRYLSIPQYGVPVRAALEDVGLEGQLITAAETVTISTRHLAFGHGVHRRFGQQLAWMELRIACRALFNRFPGRESDVIYGPGSLPVAWG
ncbi:cytochrome P450 family protein [Allokutzneria albata]|uniref:hypothetical protein n=1 Tax=Allokutzneria albata TaxID=211114 RepID=UPI0004C3F144|nr:hypothetical protein [Allokutzneria albata]